MKNSSYQNSIYLILFSLLLLPLSNHAQQKYNSYSAKISSLQDRKSVIMTNNNISVFVSNYGGIGPGYGGFTTERFYWKNLSYVFQFSPVVGASVPDPDNSSNRLHIISDAVWDYPSLREINPENPNELWNINPLPGYADPDQEKVASNPDVDSDGDGKPDSWPTEWYNPNLGEYLWPPFLTESATQPALEVFWVMDDRDNKEFSYQPFTYDPTRGGIGVEISARAFQWDEFGLDNSIFFIYDITNVSDKDLDTVFFGMYGDADIGGRAPENMDDKMYFLNPNDEGVSPPLKGLYYFFDEDGIGDYGIPTGYLGCKFIESPAENLAAISSWQWATDNVSNDLSMWLRALPGNYDIVNTPADVVSLASIGYFSLMKGETKRIAFVMSMGDNLNELSSNIQNAQLFYDSNFNINEVISLIHPEAPSYYQSINGNYSVKWLQTEENTTVNIFFSKDAGETYERIAENIPNIGSYDWNTNETEDTPFGKLRIVIRNNNGRDFAFGETGYFSINNSGNGSPFVKILNKESLIGTTIENDNYEFSLLMGDPESVQLTLNIYYGFGENPGFYLYKSIVVNSDSIEQNIVVNLKELPNSPILKLKFEVFDDEFTNSDQTPAFTKKNNHQGVTSANFQKTSGYSQSSLEVRVINPAQLTDDEYIITFDDTSNSDQKYFSVYNYTKGNYILNEQLLIPFSESPVFDGLTLYTEDFTTEIDMLASGWNIPNNITFSASAQLGNVYGYKNPHDYMFVFYSDSIFQSYSLENVAGYPSIPVRDVNFKVYDITDASSSHEVQFGYPIDNTPAGTISNGDLIVLSDKDGTGKSWFLNFSGTQNYEPGDGITLSIITKKGLSIFDTLKVSGNISTEVRDINASPQNFILEQNYPNPFNPVTTIEYQIPNSGNVSLKIYDVLGNEIKTLVAEFTNSGRHQVIFDASSIRGGLASGLYFFRLMFDGKVITRKMLLLK